MNPSSDKVLHSLTGSENIEDISTHELQKLTEENPYFSVARFLLTKKLKAENSSNFLPEVQKTALFFSNPFWLNYQLAIGPQQEIQPDEEEFVSETQNISLLSSTELPENKETFDHIPEETFENGILENSSANAEKASQPEEEMVAITREPDAETEQFLEEAASTEKTFIPDKVEAVLMGSKTATGLETMEVLEEMPGAAEQTDEATAEFLSEATTPAEETAGQNLPEIGITAFSFNNTEERNDIIKENKNDETTEQDEHEIMFQNIKAMLDATTEEANADTKNPVIPIDPYYTIDYFASQGIKLDLDRNPRDELGQHLKKFTHWLKQMKKLGPEDAAQVIASTETDADIQKIAESSNTAREVVTEAMAAVLEKQGKKDKAIELYNKLSFLNPDKSAYFAAKIKNLKGF